jgi:hypothetical protein
VIATGNNGFLNSMGAPGCISSAVSVGATTDADAVAGFSNSATFMELLAPGVDIKSADAGGTGQKSLQGTSMATPHVAGTWALMKQADTCASVTDVLNALTTTGVLVDDIVVQDIPRIQVNDALLELIGPVDPNQLVVNGNFDTNCDVSAKYPDSWLKSGTLLGDKLRVDGTTIFANSAPNAFQLKAVAGEGTSILYQNVSLALHPLAVGDSLVLSAFIDQKTAPVNLVIGKAVIKYSDATPKTQIKLRTPATVTAGYVQISSDPFVLASADISKMNVQFYYVATSGKFFLDDVTLTNTPAALGAAIPLPSAPDADLRGN